MVRIDKNCRSGMHLVQYVDWAINLPSFYRLANAMPKHLKKLALEKIAKQAHADVVFVSFPLVLPKLKNSKVVQIIYDLIPFEIVEESVESQWLSKLAARIDHVIRNSDLIFTVSQDSKEKIQEIAPEANLHIIGGAISAFEEEIKEYTEDSSILAKLNLRNTPYLVFISSVERRKNVHRLIQAFVAIAHENNATLVIVGNKANTEQGINSELERVPKEVLERIIFTGYLPEFDKYTLLKHARALVNPTLYEGFGLPVLEAFALGCPVVASVAGALAELSGEATLRIENPYSVSNISSTLREILTNDALCNTLIKKGYIEAERYTEEVMRALIDKAISKLEF